MEIVKEDVGIMLIKIDSIWLIIIISNKIGDIGAKYLVLSKIN